LQRKKQQPAKVNRREKPDQQPATKDFCRTTGKEISRRLYDTWCYTSCASVKLPHYPGR
jgi:hypothetical protein